MRGRVPQEAEVSKEHRCCWHPLYQPPRPDGSVIQQCCACNHTRWVTAEHALEKR